MLYRMKALDVARSQIGVTEHPPQSNDGLEVRQFLLSAGLNRPAPWCMAFVHWSFKKAGLDLVHPNGASVGFFEEWGKQHGYLVGSPRPGDVVCYRFDVDNWPDHVGIVEKVYPGRIVVIEGNTGVGNDANGGTVMRRTRSYARCKFVRIPGNDRPPKPKPVPPLRVDVAVDSKPVLVHQKVDNPAVLARVKGWLRLGRRVTITKEKP